MTYRDPWDMVMEEALGREGWVVATRIFLLLTSMAAINDNGLISAVSRSASKPCRRRRFQDGALEKLSVQEKGFFISKKFPGQNIEQTLSVMERMGRLHWK
ncbi:uncharacterized protein ARMOST_20221 [Armillaria ostoyae]|uniref:Uncharacterized protein n=1 Tax=Armillaria ostoyae TaxID=47428 RepID=A0A284S6P7_ARMOS|nr:uncharacterized protein ARMOST_20221 [Armillaria ostoyae]